MRKARNAQENVRGLPTWVMGKIERDERLDRISNVLQKAEVEISERSGPLKMVSEGWYLHQGCAEG